ncbi:MAG: ADP-heptose synthase (EC / D-glycero-beta-D-manno-heptose 7-phosphate kinase [uncultured Thiotrichaceae bacterium]|uniref:Bifunctional protein HldE n=1 Tax=uncultured Thiotrichaceae bacterium TaxID=298394 RepID=A0A6S6T3W0_9GAMM|nr:MAG: ADP-heptose synthase (EC / D-glycero-beta-D-manno-heptose 7-phosphate kinase [uncultured Thiotrichaceae bacterium]
MKMIIPNFSKARVLVVGDVMLDRYWHGSSGRISPEAPVPVVHVNNDEFRAGGASNVALNITALGAQCDLVGLTGNDVNAQALEKLLQEKQVNCEFIECAGYNTIVKLRVVAQHQQMIRLDFEDNFAIVDKTTLNEKYAGLLDKNDVVVISDYNKGTLSNVQSLIQMAKAAGKKVIVDPKGLDFEKYRGVTLMTPNRSEFEGVAGTCENEDELVEKAHSLRGALGFEALLVTRGEDGMTLIEQGEGAFHLPTYAREVFDVTGAGDTVIGTIAASLAARDDLQNAVTLANLAAGLVVQKLGTATTSLAEIHHALQEHQEIGFGVITEDELKQVIDIAHHKGEKIIMTNGCFDILHPGHIDYLQKARQLGDRLVVAVNSDESVRNLKGDSRPINVLADRMLMLAALECVDWVVPFLEETPERLYCHVLPDTIVKGGDYQPEDVAGGDCVKNNGGGVQIIAFVDGHSTSKIIDKIKFY